MIIGIRHRHDRSTVASVSDILQSITGQLAVGTHRIRKRVDVDRKLSRDAQVTGYVDISPLRRRQPVAPTHEMIPVSYTHLDVYKRQVPTIVDDMVEAAGIEPASEGQATGTSTGLAPVFYLAAPAPRSGIRRCRLR